ncbi:DUF2243 domain-containing protein [Caldimonas thermodepolymerans]|uniref:Membrane protein n=1 Tax=Caldimonas thermodepolymerans TaxID=215580 RepID=A0AA46HWS9_9BURK|nr:DUF2243 domain-containing protein [Caldimonas thermodepolymerans]TCP08767.1 putative membrane protein [Caldimonas thermodepolymerans]UZG47089.1 DUF2243 domain-containing protein [Caldimonas thermodepolymerans]
MQPTAIPDPRLRRAGVLLGIALGGFFDGILLHQILQWHHLLSGLDGPGWQDLRVQVLADGLFHLLMYLLAAAGLWGLVRAAPHAPGSARALSAALLLGFGAWHVLDAVLSHWWLGLHRIRMDVAQPLAWDLGWLLGFGLLPVLGGWWLGRREGARPAGAWAVLVGAVTLAAATAATQPAPGAAHRLTLLLAPGTPPARALHAAAQADARIVWASQGGSVWVLALPEGATPASGYRAGVLALGGRWAAAACAGWGGGGRRLP